jgi:hypothetical protein
MKTLSQLCKPRDSVFDPQKRDTVLDLTDLVDDRIDPAEFFAENHITEGMKALLEHGMRRLEGKSDQGVFKLKQAMGGGKTHNLLALGLLARHAEFRERVLGSFYKPDPSLGPVKVVALRVANPTRRSESGARSPNSLARRIISRIATHRCRRPARKLGRICSPARRC